MASGTPIISVLIACVNGSPMIEECLDHLARQRGSISAEIIVADITGEATSQLIKARFPHVTLLSFPNKRSIPELRTAALESSSGKIIAVIEDHCNVHTDWYEQIVKAHSAHPECVAVGGAVENGSRDRIVDWAVFFCEYSPFMRPIFRGISDGITGNNVSYKKSAFDGWDDSQFLREGFWETTLHPRLRGRGEQFWMEPDIVVDHKKHFPFWYFAGQRFVYSRYYAGLLAEKMTTPRRVLRGLASFALPPLLLYRIVSRVAAKKRHQKELLLAAPCLGAFTGIWAIGEVVGCFMGPGDSLADIE